MIVGVTSCILTTFFSLGVSYLIGRGFLIAEPLRILPYPGSILTYFSYSTYLVSYGSLSAYHYYQVESIVYIYLRTCAVYVDDYGIGILFIDVLPRDNNVRSK